MPLTVRVLRELFRYLIEWRSLYEAEGIDTLTAPDGAVYNLWDVEALYARVPELPLRQRQAITYYLVNNVMERDVAVMMGVSITNPIAMYATSGLERLVEWENDDVTTSPFRRQGRVVCPRCGTPSAYDHPREGVEFLREHACDLVEVA